MTLFDVLDATWPAAATRRQDGWLLRDGAGGGKRVSAAIQLDVDADLAQAEAAMDRKLFMVRGDETGLDAQLAAADYRMLDPTALYEAAIDQLINGPLPIASTYPVWEPLHVMKEVWATGGTGPERLAVMHRVTGPKTGIMGRNQDRVVGTAFVAIHNTTAMVHSIEVLPDHRRCGVARRMMQHAAHWARDHGADTISLAVVKDNTAARTLYSSLGMRSVGQYHYRLKES